MLVREKTGPGGIVALDISKIRVLSLVVGDDVIVLLQRLGR